MGAATALPVRELRVEPGSTTTAKMLVRNTGQVVDQYTIDIVGNSAEWTTVEPKIVNLLPGADIEVTINFAPAKSCEVLAGVVPFGVRVLSREDPQGSAVAEGSIEVAPFSDVQVELVPKQSTGRRRGKHQVAIDNNGNQPTTVQVDAHDEQEELDFKLDHRVASIEPGAAAFIRLKAVPDRRFLKGADRQHQFVVTVVPSNAEPIATRGVMTQRQLLPSWLLPALAIAAALVIAAIVLYETVMKPQINSQAKDAALKAAKAANSSLASQASSAQSAASVASSQAQAAQSAASKANSNASSAKSNVAQVSSQVSQVQNGGAGGGPSGPHGENLNGGTAVEFGVNANVAQTNNPNNFTSVPLNFTIPNNKLLVINYIVMQNPNGDAGTLVIQHGNTPAPLLTEGLANFRDLDHPFPVPLIFTAGQPVKVGVNCAKAGRGTTCQPGVLFDGRLVTAKKSSP